MNDMQNQSSLFAELENERQKNLSSMQNQSTLYSDLETANLKIQNLLSELQS